MHNYTKIINAVYGSAWAIQPEKLEAILDFLRYKADDGILSEEEIEKVMATRSVRSSRVSGQVAVIPLVGTISQRIGMMAESSGGISTERFARNFDEAMANKSVGAIVIDTDSPGGSVYGVSELSNHIYSARGTKPIVAVSNSLMASAAYWIGSAADEIVVTPGGEVGSIGVLSVHTDISKAEEEMGIKYTIVKAGKYKAEGNPHEPLSDEALTEYQSRVDEYYDMFVGDVARNRGTSKNKVLNDFGQGRVVGASQAVAAGMVDRVATLDKVITDIGTVPKRSAYAMQKRFELRSRQTG